MIPTSNDTLKMATETSLTSVTGILIIRHRPIDLPQNTISERLSQSIRRHPASKLATKHY